MLTFVAFFPLPQPRFGKPPIFGAESRRLIRISLRRRLGRRGEQGRTERDGGPAGFHASVCASAVAWTRRRKIRKDRLEGEGRRRGARSIIESTATLLSARGPRPHPPPRPWQHDLPFISDATDLGLNTFDPWHL